MAALALSTIATRRLAAGVECVSSDDAGDAAPLVRPRRPRSGQVGATSGISANATDAARSVRPVSASQGHTRPQACNVVVTGVPHSVSTPNVIAALFPPEVGVAMAGWRDMGYACSDPVRLISFPSPGDAARALSAARANVSGLSQLHIDPFNVRPDRHRDKPPSSRPHVLFEALVDHPVTAAALDSTVIAHHMASTPPTAAMSRQWLLSACEDVLSCAVQGGILCHDHVVAQWVQGEVPPSHSADPQRDDTHPFRPRDTSQSAPARTSEPPPHSDREGVSSGPGGERIQVGGGTHRPPREDGRVQLESPPEVHTRAPLPSVLASPDPGPGDAHGRSQDPRRDTPLPTSTSVRAAPPSQLPSSRADPRPAPPMPQDSIPLRPTTSLGANRFGAMGPPPLPHPSRPTSRPTAAGSLPSASAPPRTSAHRLSPHSAQSLPVTVMTAPLPPGVDNGHDSMGAAPDPHPRPPAHPALADRDRGGDVGGHTSQSRPRSPDGDHEYRDDGGVLASQGGDAAIPAVSAPNGSLRSPVTRTTAWGDVDPCPSPLAHVGGDPLSSMGPRSPLTPVHDTWPRGPSPAPRGPPPGALPSASAVVVPLPRSSHAPPAVCPSPRPLLTLPASVSLPIPPPRDLPGGGLDTPCPPSSVDPATVDDQPRLRTHSPVVEPRDGVGGGAVHPSPACFKFASGPHDAGGRPSLQSGASARPHAPHRSRGSRGRGTPASDSALDPRDVVVQDSHRAVGRRRPTDAEAPAMEPVPPEREAHAAARCALQPSLAVIPSVPVSDGASPRPARRTSVADAVHGGADVDPHSVGDGVLPAAAPAPEKRHRARGGKRRHRRGGGSRRDLDDAAPVPMGGHSDPSVPPHPCAPMEEDTPQGVCPAPSPLAPQEPAVSWPGERGSIGPYRAPTSFSNTGASPHSPSPSRVSSPVPSVGISDHDRHCDPTTLHPTAASGTRDLPVFAPHVALQPVLITAHALWEEEMATQGGDHFPLGANTLPSRVLIRDPVVCGGCGHIMPSAEVPRHTGPQGLGALCAAAGIPDVIGCSVAPFTPFVAPPDDAVVSSIVAPAALSPGVVAVPRRWIRLASLVHTGMDVDMREHTIAGLVDALAAVAGERSTPAGPSPQDRGHDSPASLGPQWEWLESGNGVLRRRTPDLTAPVVPGMLLCRGCGCVFPPTVYAAHVRVALLWAYTLRIHLPCAAWLDPVELVSSPRGDRDALRTPSLVAIIPSVGPRGWPAVHTQLRDEWASGSMVPLSRINAVLRYAQHDHHRVKAALADAVARKRGPHEAGSRLATVLCLCAARDRMLPDVLLPSADPPPHPGRVVMPAFAALEAIDQAQLLFTGRLSSWTACSRIPDPFDACSRTLSPLSLESGECGDAGAGGGHRPVGSPGLTPSSPKHDRQCDSDGSSCASPGSVANPSGPEVMDSVRAIALGLEASGRDSATPPLSPVNEEPVTALPPITPVASGVAALWAHAWCGGPADVHVPEVTDPVLCWGCGEIQPRPAHAAHAARVAALCNCSGMPDVVGCSRYECTPVVNPDCDGDAPLAGPGVVPIHPRWRQLASLVCYGLPLGRMRESLSRFHRDVCKLADEVAAGASPCAGLALVAPSGVAHTMPASGGDLPLAVCLSPTDDTIPLVPGMILCCGCGGVFTPRQHHIHVAVAALWCHALRIQLPCKTGACLCLTAAHLTVGLESAIRGVEPAAGPNGTLDWRPAHAALRHAIPDMTTITASLSCINAVLQWVQGRHHALRAQLALVLSGGPGPDCNARLVDLLTACAQRDAFLPEYVRPQGPAPAGVHTDAWAMHVHQFLVTVPAMPSPLPFTGHFHSWSACFGAGDGPTSLPHLPIKPDVTAVPSASKPLPVSAQPVPSGPALLPLPDLSAHLLPATSVLSYDALCGPDGGMVFSSTPTHLDRDDPRTILCLGCMTPLDERDVGEHVWQAKRLYVATGCCEPLGCSDPRCHIDLFTAGITAREHQALLWLPESPWRTVLFHVCTGMAPEQFEAHKAALSRAALACNATADVADGVSPWCVEEDGTVGVRVPVLCQPIGPLRPPVIACCGCGSVFDPARYDLHVRVAAFWTDHLRVHIPCGHHSVRSSALEGLGTGGVQISRDVLSLEATARVAYTFGLADANAVLCEAVRLNRHICGEYLAAYAAFAASGLSRSFAMEDDITDCMGPVRVLLQRRDAQLPVVLLLDELVVWDGGPVSPAIVHPQAGDPSVWNTRGFSHLAADGTPDTVTCTPVRDPASVSSPTRRVARRAALQYGHVTILGRPVSNIGSPATPSPPRLASTPSPARSSRAVSKKSAATLATVEEVMGSAHVSSDDDSVSGPTSPVAGGAPAPASVAVPLPPHDNHGDTASGTLVDTADNARWHSDSISGSNPPVACILDNSADVAPAPGTGGAPAPVEGAPATTPTSPPVDDNSDHATVTRVPSTVSTEDGVCPLPFPAVLATGAPLCGGGAPVAAPTHPLALCDSPSPAVPAAATVTAVPIRPPQPDRAHTLPLMIRTPPTSPCPDTPALASHDTHAGISVPAGPPQSAIHAVHSPVSSPARPATPQLADPRTASGTVTPAPAVTGRCSQTAADTGILRTSPCPPTDPQPHEAQEEGGVGSVPPPRLVFGTPQREVSDAEDWGMPVDFDLSPSVVEEDAELDMSLYLTPDAGVGVHTPDTLPNTVRVGTPTADRVTPPVSGPPPSTQRAYGAATATATRRGPLSLFGPPHFDRAARQPSSLPLPPSLEDAHLPRVDITVPVTEVETQGAPLTPRIMDPPPSFLRTIQNAIAEATASHTPPHARGRSTTDRGGKRWRSLYARGPAGPAEAGLPSPPRVAPQAVTFHHVQCECGSLFSSQALNNHKSRRRGNDPSGCGNVALKYRAPYTPVIAELMALEDWPGVRREAVRVHREQSPDTRRSRLLLPSRLPTVHRDGGVQASPIPLPIASSPPRRSVSAPHHSSAMSKPLPECADTTSPPVPSSSPTGPHRDVHPPPMSVLLTCGGDPAPVVVPTPLESTPPALYLQQVQQPMVDVPLPSPPVPTAGTGASHLPVDTGDTVAHKVRRVPVVPRDELPPPPSTRLATCQPARRDGAGPSRAALAAARESTRGQSRSPTVPSVAPVTRVRARASSQPPPRAEVDVPAAKRPAVPARSVSPAPLTVSRPPAAVRKRVSAVPRPAAAPASASTRRSTRRATLPWPPMAEETAQAWYWGPLVTCALGVDSMEACRLREHYSAYPVVLDILQHDFSVRGVLLGDVPTHLPLTPDIVRVLLDGSLTRETAVALSRGAQELFKRLKFFPSRVPAEVYASMCAVVEDVSAGKDVRDVGTTNPVVAGGASGAVGPLAPPS